MKQLTIPDPTGDTVVTFKDDGTIHFVAKFAVDTDGSGPFHGDPDAQADTSLHLNGQPLNADIDKYIVLPPGVIRAVAPVVLGCAAHVRNLVTNMESDAVVGDVGPRRKIGEGSNALAAALGLNPSPTRGGVETHIIEYSVSPGLPAVVDGKAYALQSYA